MFGHDIAIPNPSENLTQPPKLGAGVGDPDRVQDRLEQFQVRAQTPRGHPGLMDIVGIDARAVLRVLEPQWTRAPETASRLRARIEAVLSAAQTQGHIDPDRPNPARWRICRF